MSRRSDREGVERCEAQRRINARHAAEIERRGLADEWWKPFTAAHAFALLDQVTWAIRYRLFLFRALLSPYERAELIRVARWQLDAARRCDGPRLP